MMPLESRPHADIRPSDFYYRSSPLKRRLRRASDAAIAAFGLLVSAPIVATACLAIVLDDGLPVLFVQRRVGQYGKTFRIFKLRTMRREVSGDSLSPRDGRDARVTRIGRILRKTSIDEIPQLLNVLRGDMTLVGPRPEMPFVVDAYLSWQHMRHLSVPGITGLWQITARKTLALEHPRATLLDIEYLRKRSPLFDVSLIVRTFAAVVRPKGAF